MVSFADADAAAGDDRVGLRRSRTEGGFQQGGIIFDHAHVNHLAAEPLQQAKGGVAVAVVHSAFTRRLAQRQNLVAGRKISHTQRPPAGQAGQTQRCSQAEAGRRDDLAFEECRAALRQVFTAQAPVVTGLEHAWRDDNQSSFTTQLGDYFLGHHCVKAGRHDGPGHDLHAVTQTRRADPSFARQRRANDFEFQRDIGLQLAAVKGITVHRRVVVRRHVHRGNHIGRQHLAQRLKQRLVAALGHGCHQPPQEVEYRVGGQRLRVVTLKLGGNLRNGFHGRERKKVEVAQRLSSWCNSASVLALMKAFGSSPG